MYNALRIEENDQYKLWFVSDLHFRHNRPFIYEKRGFESIAEHDATLVERWNQRVAKHDIVVNCGDFICGAGMESESAFFEVINQLNGRHIYLWGNHNAGAKPVYDRMIRERYGKEVSEVYPLTIPTRHGSFEYRGCNLLIKAVKYTSRKRCIYSQKIFCGHYAHRLWPASHRGEVWHLSGHSHGSDPESQPAANAPLRVDVGIDNFGAPVSIEELASVFAQKSPGIVDRHGQKTAEHPEGEP